VKISTDCINVEGLQSLWVLLLPEFDYVYVVGNCSALEFVWSQESSDYAIRESGGHIKIFKNFLEKSHVKIDYAIEGMHGGSLVGKNGVVLGELACPFCRTGAYTTYRLGRLQQSEHQGAELLDLDPVGGSNHGQVPTCCRCVSISVWHLQQKRATPTEVQARQGLQA